MDFYVVLVSCFNIALQVYKFILKSHIVFSNEIFSIFFILEECKKIFYTIYGNIKKLIVQI